MDFFEGSFATACLEQASSHIRLTPLDVVFSHKSVIATLRVEKGVILSLASCLKRLFQQAHDMSIATFFVDEALIQNWVASYKRYPLLRLRLTFAVDSKSYSIKFIMQLFHYESSEKALKMALMPAPALAYPKMKTLVTLQRAEILKRAQQKGFDDVITYSSQEEVLETAFGNLFWIEQNQLFTPSPDLPYYFGQTLQNLIKISPWEVKFVKRSFESFSNQACVFKISSLSGPVPVSHIEYHRCRQDVKLHETLKQMWQKTQILS